MAVTVGPPLPAPSSPQGDRAGGTGRHRAARVREFRRTRSLGGALGVTLLGAALPGAGYIWSRRRLGYAILLPFLAGVGLVAYYVGDLGRAADLAFDPTRLEVAAIALAAVFLVWVFVVATTYLMVRPIGMPRLEKGLGALVVVLLCVLGGLPAVQACGSRQPGATWSAPSSTTSRPRRHPTTSPRRTRGAAASKSTCCCSAATGESAGPASGPTR